jgi:methylenetetrahydrofolate dehydrogenase (NADP+)/methenyltetrahydrofolate cyclohydrolase
MTARVLDGRALAAVLRDEIAGEVSTFRHEFGHGPALAIVRVGNDPASISYARQIDKSFTEVGFGYELEVLPENATSAELASLLQHLSRDPDVHGVLLQRPLPQAINPDAVMAHFPTQKDVEGVTPSNIGALMLNTGEYFPTTTPSAAIVLLRRSGIPTKGKHAVVVGRSNILGRPMSLLLLHENATVTTCHSQTENLGAYTRQADILINAVGKPGLIKGDMVKPGATVIDFGVNIAGGGDTYGDVDFAQVKEVAGAITPVPGGTGPITTVMLMRNTLDAARRQIPRDERRLAKNGLASSFAFGVSSGNHD